MARTDFTLIANFVAIVNASTTGTDPNPFNQAITGLVDFKPSIKYVWSELDECSYTIETFTYRLDDGVLADVPRRPLDPSLPAEAAGEPLNHKRYGIRLAANGPAFGPLAELTYLVTFRNVVFNRKDQKLPAFRFTAPHEDITLDLARIPHFAPRR